MERREKNQAKMDSQVKSTLPWRALEHCPCLSHLVTMRMGFACPNQSVIAAGSPRVYETPFFSPGQFSREQGICEPVMTNTLSNWSKEALIWQRGKRRGTVVSPSSTYFR